MQKNGYVTVFNAPRSLDTNWIENCFKVPKTYVRKYEIWDLEDLRELAEEGWKKLTIRMINGLVETMPQRWKDIIEAEGQMTAWQIDVNFVYGGECGAGLWEKTAHLILYPPACPSGIKVKEKGRTR